MFTLYMYVHVSKLYILLIQVTLARSMRTASGTLETLTMRTEAQYSLYSAKIQKGEAVLALSIHPKEVEWVKGTTATVDHGSKATTPSKY
jgi:hypothetical protein